MSTTPSMDFSRFYREVHEMQDPRPDGPHGWIQWKGTDACIDLHCACGHHGHLDEGFLYHYRCPKCRRAYALAANIKLIPLTAEQEAFVDGGGACAFRSDAIDDGETDELDSRPSNGAPAP